MLSPQPQAEVSSREVPPSASVAACAAPAEAPGPSPDQVSELKRKILAAVNLADYNLAGELNAELVAVVEQQQAQNPAAEAHAPADDAAAATAAAPDNAVTENAAADVADSPRQLRSDAAAEENSLWHNGDQQPEEWSNDFPTLKFPDTDCPVCGRPPGKNVR